jgi:hypothetical protein
MQSGNSALLALLCLFSAACAVESQSGEAEFFEPDESATEQQVSLAITTVQIGTTVGIPLQTPSSMSTAVTTTTSVVSTQPSLSLPAESDSSTGSTEAPGTKQTSTTEIPAPSSTQPVGGEGSSEARIEEIKRGVYWPPKPDLGSDAWYAQEYWQIVDVPEDEVLIVSLVHDWLFAPGDAQTAAAIAARLAGQGWPGLPEAFDPERRAYKIQSNSLPGCGVLGEVVCMVRVYVDSGAVEVVQTYYA